MGAQTTTYRMWKRLAGRPGGTRLFSTAAMVRVPYFASIVPHVVRMEPGLAEVTVPKWLRLGHRGFITYETEKPTTISNSANLGACRSACASTRRAGQLRAKVQCRPRLAAHGIKTGCRR